VADLCAALRAIGGVEAVTVGGSRATGTADAASDWDIGLYYRGQPDFSALTRHGELHPPGAWGRIMNGGAWLSLGGLKVDVLLRDLDVAEHWSARAREGVYEVDALLGYVAGVPTYSLTAELALNRVIAGTLPRGGEFPPALARTAPARWRRHAEFSLAHARMRAERGDVVGTVAQAAKAIMETAHAVVCERREWVLNEKGLVERAGLRELHAQFTHVPPSAPGLVEWVDALRGRI
jgi:hypothetical protein